MTILEKNFLQNLTIVTIFFFKNQLYEWHYIVFGHQMVNFFLNQKFKHWWKGVIKTRPYSTVCLMSLYFFQV
jgi:hypothetical protein